MNGGLLLLVGAVLSKPATAEDARLVALALGGAMILTVVSIPLIALSTWLYSRTEAGKRPTGSTGVK